MMKYSYSTGGFYNPAIHANYPADAVDVTASQYKALLEGLSTGMKIAPGTNGLPKLTQAPQSISAQRLCFVIDSAADAARQTIAGDALRAVEYERSRLEAEAFKAAGYQGDVPRMVAAWAINGRTPRQAADNILAEAAAYTEALYVIRETRLQAKEMIRSAVNAGNIEQAQDIADETVAFIDNAVVGIGNNAGT